MLRNVFVVYFLYVFILQFHIDFVVVVEIDRSLFVIINLEKRQRDFLIPLFALRDCNKNKTA